MRCQKKIMLQFCVAIEEIIISQPSKYLSRLYFFNDGGKKAVKIFVEYFTICFTGYVTVTVAEVINFQPSKYSSLLPFLNDGERQAVKVFVKYLTDCLSGYWYLLVFPYRLLLCMYFRISSTYFSFPYFTFYTSNECLFDIHGRIFSDVRCFYFFFYNILNESFNALILIFL